MARDLTPEERAAIEQMERELRGYVENTVVGAVEEGVAAIALQGRMAESVERANALPVDERVRLVAMVTGWPAEKIADATFSFELGDPFAVDVHVWLRSDVDQVYCTVTIKPPEGD